jgi:hypothetical protein
MWSKEHQVPYAFKKNQWVGYDDESSINIKVRLPMIKRCDFENLMKKNL